MKKLFKFWLHFKNILLLPIQNKNLTSLRIKKVQTVLFTIYLLIRLKGPLYNTTVHNNNKKTRNICLAMKWDKRKKPYIIFNELRKALLQNSIMMHNYLDFIRKALKAFFLIILTFQRNTFLQRCHATKFNFYHYQ